VRKLATRLLALVVALVVGAAPLAAHEMRPAYLELRERAADEYDVLWKVPALAGNLRLRLDVVLPADVETVGEPAAGFVGTSHLTRWRIRRAGGLAGCRIEVAGLSSTFTDALVRIERADGSTLAHRLTPDRPAWNVDARPGAWQLVVTYAGLGVEHILLGVDHLLFVLGLLLIVRGRGMLLRTVTAFTLAHSLTLGLATLGYAQAPLPPLNAAIALSILFLGPEIVRAWRGGTSLTIRHPSIVAFLFGLLHGFGFATGLETIGLPRHDVVLGLLWFNVGVELGQLGFVVRVMWRSAASSSSSSRCLYACACISAKIEKMPTTPAL
jgi:hydrogenase/urease accessory protein HupE